MTSDFTTSTKGSYPLHTYTKLSNKCFGRERTEAVKWKGISYRGNFFLITIKIER